MKNSLNAKIAIAAFSIILIGALFFVPSWLQPPFPAERNINNLTALQTKTLDYVVEMNKLLISLALLVIGACAAFIVQKYSNIKVKGVFPTIIILTCIVFAAFSVFSGYALYNNLVLMLSNDFFNANSPLLRWQQDLQFYSFFISVALFGFFIVYNFMEGKEPEPEEKKPLLVQIVGGNELSDTETEPK